jgi:holo-[acyl-carrier protein] synthase
MITPAFSKSLGSTLSQERRRQLRRRDGRVAPSMGGLGMDLLEVERLETALARRPRLAARLFTDQELAYAAGRARPALALAARFCAKEAVAKALELDEWTWHDVEIVGGGGPPVLRLAGAAADRAAALSATVEISLTHTRGMAGAVAVLSR